MAATLSGIAKVGDMVGSFVPSLQPPGAGLGISGSGMGLGGGGGGSDGGGSPMHTGRPGTAGAVSGMRGVGVTGSRVAVHLGRGASLPEGAPALLATISASGTGSASLPPSRASSATAGGDSVRPPSAGRR